MDESVVGRRGDAHAAGAADALDPTDPLDPEMTLVCRQVVELVTEYLEGALPEQLRDAVERHLELCPACVLYVEQIRATAEAVRAAPVESIDPRTRAHLVSAFRDLIPGPGNASA